MELIIILVAVAAFVYVAYKAFAKKADADHDGHVSQAEAKAVVEEAKVEVKKVVAKAKTTATKAKTAVKKATTTAKK